MIEINGQTTTKVEYPIIPAKCDGECYECWHSDFIGMVPVCFEECCCDTCQKYEKLSCLNKKEECKGNCPMQLA